MEEKITGSEPIKMTDKPNSPVEEEDEKTYTNCIWNGHEYSPGAYICRGNRIKMICHPKGHWTTIVVTNCV